MFNCDTRMLLNGLGLKYLDPPTEDLVLCHILLTLSRYDRKQEELHLGNGPFGVSWHSFGS